jgi:2-polyprenyl-6-methoxyphenol hydroxylase-like FAD-dependent oxidoreductase
MRKKVVIVGGGTAGWMTANLMARRWADRDFDIQLLESPEIGIIGVGEGSTPQLKAFFDTIGVQESEWMPQCNATYKVGIAFNGWSTKTGFEHYFHPFPAQADLQNYPAFINNCQLRRQGIDVHAHPDRYFVPSLLAKQGLGPIANDSFPFPVRYGYHFDSQLLGQFLRSVATSRGVRHFEAQVAEVARNEVGDIACLKLLDGGSVAADFFVDCTGFRGMLLQQAMQVPFHSFADNLFNDAAVVMPTAQRANPHAQTTSTALKHGWAWHIPLTQRVGNGYVYSSAHCTADAAETELRERLGLLDSPVMARHLRMRVGRVASTWSGNCLAVGLSQGFIEPLEATALHLVLETAEGFINCYERGGFSNKHRDELNQSIAQRFDGIRDYIVCHYRVSSRNDTEYWRANGSHEQLSDSLRALLSVWLNREDLSAEIERLNIGAYYNTISWHCLLAGYGIFPNAPYRSPGNSREVGCDMRMIDDFVARCALNFKPHSEQLSGLRR